MNGTDLEDAEIPQNLDFRRYLSSILPECNRPTLQVFCCVGLFVYVRVLPEDTVWNSQPTLRRIRLPTSFDSYFVF
ncbi:hypothetical protein CEXT_392331 [Caerostris extrusa]|uniref:Uncharacterized protein n=1 Tax=Caerostris extrusa TaxID=172846 RepID=A0AAV4Y5B0_CAEEX|nr:hypothetical protein CEXT_392331 [Caerostris extrusa]